MSTVFLRARSSQETRDLAAKLAEHAQSGDIYCLEGQLGAGKTVFAQGFARGLGIHDSVTSPSFPIIQEYEHDPPLYHIDFYRLSGTADLLEMGADEIFLGSGISLIEWPDRAAELLPESIIRVCIDIAGDTERLISIVADKERIRDIEDALS